MKKYFVLLLVLVNVLTAIPIAADSTQVRFMTLEEAQKIALDNNIKYQLQDSYISDKLEDYYDTQDANEKTAGVPSTGFMSYFNKTITPEISVDSAANAVQLSRFEKKDIKRVSDYNVKIAVLNVKKARLTLENKKNDTANKLKELEVARIKHQIGYITNNELKQFEKAYSDSVKDQLAANEDLYSRIQTLNRYLGRAITDYNIEVVYSPIKVSFDTLSLDALREDNIKNNKEFYSLEQNLKLAKRKYDLTKERYEHFEKLGVQNSKQQMLDAYTDAERDYENAKKSFEDATKDLDISLNTAYNKLKNSIDAIDRLERDMADAKEDFEILKLRYDLGADVSKMELDKQELAMKTMENELTSLLADADAQYSNLMLYTSDTNVASK